MIAHTQNLTQLPRHHDIIKELNIESALAEKLVQAATEESKKLAAEPKQNQAENILQQQKEVKEQDK